jgi:hypothetical protein
MNKHGHKTNFLETTFFQMRRNVCDGRFELWRLFLTDSDSLPVKKMSIDTTFRELRSEHRKSTFNHQTRRVKINRYWNEDYLVTPKQEEFIIPPKSRH